MPDTEKHLSSVYNILNDNGKYIIKTPNKLLENIYYKGILLRSDKQKIHPWWTAHVSLFSLKKLCFSLRSAGFKKINILRQRELSEAQIKKIKLISPKFLSNIFIAIAKVIIRMLPLRLSVCFIVVAEK